MIWSFFQWFGHFFQWVEHFSMIWTLFSMIWTLFFNILDTFSNDLETFFLWLKHLSQLFIHNLTVRDRTCIITFRNKFLYRETWPRASTHLFATSQFEYFSESSLEIRSISYCLKALLFLVIFGFILYLTFEIGSLCNIWYTTLLKRVCSCRLY